MSTTLNPETAEWLKGPELVKWLKTKRPGKLSPTITRRFWAWEHRDNQPSIWAVDRILVDLDLHIRDLPPDLWTTAPNNPGQNGHPGRQGHAPSLRQRVLEEIYATGDPQAVVARRNGVAAQTVSRWVEKGL